MVNDSIDKIWVDLANTKCPPKLINQFSLHKFIPNKWFDWNLNNKPQIMIVGQDWGPYVILKKYVDRYDVESKTSEFDYEQFLFSTFSSRTEKFLLKSLESSFEKKFKRNIEKKEWLSFLFTVAEFFCRSGTLFRGSQNFDNLGTILSLPFLKRQINLVKPKVILTLGDMALRQVFLSLELPIKFKNLTQFIKENEDKKYVEVNNTIIIPSFHPAAHVNPKLIHEKIALVWEFIDIK